MPDGARAAVCPVSAALRITHTIATHRRDKKSRCAVVLFGAGGTRLRTVSGAYVDAGDPGIVPLPSVRVSALVEPLNEAGTDPERFIPSFDAGSNCSRSARCCTSMISSM